MRVLAQWRGCYIDPDTGATSTRRVFCDFLIAFLVLSGAVFWLTALYAYSARHQGNASPQDTDDISAPYSFPEIRHANGRAIFAASLNET